jgi:hypothetical protein
VDRRFIAAAVIAWAMACPSPAPIKSEALCAGRTCPAGTACCQLDGTCYDPAYAATACPRPKAIRNFMHPPCGSDLDCEADEFCQADDPRLCLGAGYCVSKTYCGTCTPEGDAQCQRCGCNGVTYPSIQAACRVGVRMATDGVCGQPVEPQLGARQIGCGSSAQCPDASVCCMLTGECVDPSQQWRCELTADAAVLDCESNAECLGGTGGSGGANAFFCMGEGCDTPGTCWLRPSNCFGGNFGFCGCDGQNYDFECQAHNARTRVAFWGRCDGG